MKQKKLYFSIIVAACAVLASCSSDDAVEPRGGEITLTSVVGMTRAVSNLQATQVDAAVQVGAFGLDGTTLLTNGDNNSYNANGTGSLTATKNMIWPTAGKATIYAYAPYASGWAYNTANAFSVQTDQSSKANYLASDLLYGVPASNPVDQTTTAVPLTFTHKLAKVNITVNKGTTTKTLTGAKVYVTNTLNSTTFTPNTGAIAEASGAANPILAGTLSSESAETVSVVIVPQTIASGKRLILLTLADNSSLDAKLDAATTFEGGKVYDFTASVNTGSAPTTEVTLSLGTTQISDWGATTNIGNVNGEYAE